MSLLRWKQKLFADGGVARGGSSGGGSSGSPAPTQTNVTNTNIPTYAQPYVETMLGAAQQQIFNYDDSGNVTSMKPYTPYSSSPTDYVAGFSPLQQQAQSNIANMQTPGQYATGTDYATTAGLGALSTANTAAQYGGLGANFGASAASLAPQAQQYGQNAADIGAVGGMGYGGMGAQAGQTAAALGTMGGMRYGNQGAQAGQLAGAIGTVGGLGYGNAGMQAGQNAAGYGALGAEQGLSYGQNATNAGAVQSYMNPYLQATLNPAMQLQNQQFGQINAQNQGQATQQGAFGGGRQAVMQGLNQQNQMLAQNQLVGNAYNQAYNTANQNMQTAANLGMQGTAQGIQGQQAAMQGAGVGLSGVNAALAGQQANIQGANTGLAGVNAGLAGQQAAMQGAGVGLSGVNAAMQGQQAGLQGLSTANQLYGQGISGANTGLQGTAAQQAAYQQLGAQGTNLANIAGQQTGTELNIAQAQQAAGAAQQAQQQNIINQQIQNYATAQQYPMTQLANMSSLLRGLPMQATTTQSYQAAPSSVSTLAGLGTAGIGAYKLATAAQGGSTEDIVKMAKGGIASGVPAPKLDAMLGRLDDKQLAQKADPRMNDPQTAQAATGQQAFRSQMRPAGIGQNYNYQGAGGGIVAFAEGDVVKDDSSIKSMLMQEYKTPMEEQIAKNKAMQPKTDFATKYGDMLSQAGLTTEADAKSSQGLRLLQAGMGMMGGASPFGGVNIGQGVQPAIAGYAQDVKEQKQAKLDLAKQQFELGKFGYNSEADILKAYREDKKATRDDLVKILGSETAADAAIKAAQIHAGATVAAAGISAEKASAKDKAGIKIEYDALVAQGYSPDSPITLQKAQQQYFAATRPYGATQVASALGDRIAKDQELNNLFKQQRTLEFTGTDAEKKANAAAIEARRRAVETEFNTQLGNAKSGGAQPVVTPNIPGNTQVPVGGKLVPGQNGILNYVPNQ